jgi:hypothetical protein
MGNEQKAQGAGHRKPNPEDLRLDYNTFLYMYNQALANGDIDEGGNLDDGIEDRRTMMVRVDALEEVSGDSASTVPDDTPVYMVTGEEVHWDSSQNKYVPLAGGNGCKFDGVDQNQIRLVGLPGQAENPYSYKHLPVGAVIPVTRVEEEYVLQSTSEEATDIKVISQSYQSFYQGGDPVVHPFKATVGSTKRTIKIGNMRDHIGNAGDNSDAATKSHTGKDFITILNGSNPIIIEFDTADELELAGLQGTDSIIYYAIDLSSYSPTPTLLESENAEWPPSGIADPANVLLIPVCYCRIVLVGADVIIGTIGQLLFNNPVFTQGGINRNTLVARSVTSDSGVEGDPLKDRIQLVNDFDVLGPESGDVSELYGGIESTADIGPVVQRSYFPNWDEANPEVSYLNPMSKGGSETGVGLNEREIRIGAVGQGHTTEIRHGVLKGSDLNAEIYDSFWAYENDPSISGVVEYVITKTRHVHPKTDDGSSYPDDPYKGIRTQGVGIQSPLPTVPAAGSLYSAEMSITTYVTDADGNPTAEFDGPGNLEYTGTVNGENLELSTIINPPIAQAINVDVAELGGGPNHGNSQTLRFNLARHLNGADLNFKAKVLEAPFAIDVVQIQMRSVEIKHELVGISVIPKGVAFTLRVSLVDQNGARFSQFDGLGEYQLITKCFYKSDNGEASPDQSPFVVAINANTESGADITYTLNPPPERDNAAEQVCFETELHFTTKPGALPGQFGRAYVLNANNKITTCEFWDSPTYSIVAISLGFTPPSVCKDPATVAENIVIDNLQPMSQLAEALLFEVEYKNAGADTNVLSTAGVKALIGLKYKNAFIAFGTNGPPVGTVQKVNSGESAFIEYDVQAAAGFFTTDHLSTNEAAFDLLQSTKLVDGGQYVFVVKTEGCADLEIPFQFCSVPPVSQEYTECGGVATIYVDPDVSLSADVVSVSGTCYELTESSSQTAVDTLAIDNSYSDCPTCEADQGSEKWEPCTAPNACDGGPACGGDPSIQLTVTADDVDLPITWCGKTWVASTETPGVNQAYSGTAQCVCPTTYIAPHNNTLVPTAEHIWRHYDHGTNELLIQRFSYSGLFSAENRLSLRLDATNNGINLIAYDVFRYYFSSFDYSTFQLGLISAIIPTVSNYQITDSYFGTYSQSGIDFTWAKGERW